MTDQGAYKYRPVKYRCESTNASTPPSRKVWEGRGFVNDPLQVHASGRKEGEGVSHHDCWGCGTKLTPPCYLKIRLG